MIFQSKNWIQVKFSRPKLSLKLVKLTWTQKLKKYQYGTELKTPKTGFRLGGTQIANQKKEILSCFFVRKVEKFLYQIDYLLDFWTQKPHRVFRT